MLELDELCELDNSRKKSLCNIKEKLYLWMNDKSINTCTFEVKQNKVIIHSYKKLDDIIIEEFCSAFSLFMVLYSLTEVHNYSDYGNPVGYTKSYKYVFKSDSHIF